ncbi:sigma-54 dependent transcriptional regulator [Accumulibacter sp.]|jgi:two-component system response regulator PilR (NtrC family)|uniref:Two component, sigma54 specific, transcriptional regulator, Fis family n=1 Tax=Accumulibacter regalis TaxID=522306 RepID=C7RNH7_ACCRE|nr:sigma-54 dependent transcriptional regulator [Accumulibacter sp.]MBN8495484.1 sigma-54-dependent Fis family transcriptional regulator [Accumulibacter sp.]MBO3714098.1 sigma-54-dependent Fis family transcriptional regulator [Accumulibacter sp.]
MSLGKAERRPRGELARVLVVDDEADIRELLDLTVARMGLSADCAATVAQARQLLEQHRYQLCLTDMRLPDGEGLEIVRLIGERYGETPVAVITAFGSAQNAVAALKAGAFDYLAKPVALDQLRSLIKSALSLPTRSGSSEAGQPSGAAAQLIGESMAIAQVRQMIEKLARSQAPLYVSGESGTGKELAARLIHDHSARRTAPFVPVNCGAIPENLMESEFFGYRKGAFTGADSDRAGFFQAATGGTLFLDEVADLPLLMQVKLLRAIQEKKVRKVGSTVEEAVDVRIISATHRMLKDCVDAGSFRQDLYYRLNVIELRMPPLRERQEDVEPLVAALLVRICGAQPPRVEAAAMRALKAYSFPGNVRELENVLERATALCSNDTVLIDDLQLAPVMAVSDSVGRDGETLDDYINRVEKQAIVEALTKTDFNRTAAARLLGVTFRSLRYRIERLGIEE